MDSEHKENTMKLSRLMASQGFFRCSFCKKWSHRDCITCCDECDNESCDDCGGVRTGFDGSFCCECDDSFEREQAAIHRRYGMANEGGQYK